MIYFVREGNDGPVKIGYSRDVGARLRALQTGVSRPLVVVAVQQGSLADEAVVQERFAYLRRRGEWFEATPELLAYAADVNGSEVERARLRWHRTGLVDGNGVLTRAGCLCLLSLEEIAAENGCDIEAGAAAMRDLAGREALLIPAG